MGISIMATRGNFEHRQASELELSAVQQRMVDAIDNDRIRLGADGNNIIPPPDLGDGIMLVPYKGPSSGEEGAEIDRPSSEKLHQYLGATGLRTPQYA